MNSSADEIKYRAMNGAETSQPCEPQTKVLDLSVSHVQLQEECDEVVLDLSLPKGQTEMRGDEAGVDVDNSSEGHPCGDGEDFSFAIQEEPLDLSMRSNSASPPDSEVPLPPAPTPGLVASPNGNISKPAGKGDKGKRGQRKGGRRGKKRHCDLSCIDDVVESASKQHVLDLENK